MTVIMNFQEIIKLSGTLYTMLVFQQDFWICDLHSFQYFTTLHYCKTPSEVKNKIYSHNLNSIKE